MPKENTLGRASLVATEYRYEPRSLQPSTDMPKENILGRNLPKARVPGLPIGDCAGSSNNLVPRGAKLSATDVTLKVFFERLYWFQD